MSFVVVDGRPSSLIPRHTRDRWAHFTWSRPDRIGTPGPIGGRTSGRFTQTVTERFNSLRVRVGGLLPVAEVEVMPPGFAVPADFPGALDALAVAADGAREALAEVERREIRFVTPKLPQAIVECHLINACHST